MMSPTSILTRTCATITLLVCVGGPVAAATAVKPPDDADIPRIRTRTVEVLFEAAEPESVRSVELWYTRDCAQSWELFRPDRPQRYSPVVFVAPREGLYGLFVIVSSRTGNSSDRPTPGSAPHQWCFVDWSPPVVQLTVAAKDEAFSATRRIPLRWSAYDAFLVDRPIDLYHMAVGQRLWTPIAQSLPNSGRYDWRVPDELTSAVRIKLVVRDRGGHVVERFSEPIRLEPRSFGPPAKKLRPAQMIAVPQALANQPMAAVEDCGPDAPSANATQPPHIGESRPTPEPSPAHRSPSAASRRQAIRRTDARHRSPSASKATGQPAETHQMRTAHPSTVPRRPTTIAAAVEDPPANGPARASPTSRPSPAEAAAIARALRLYKAGTYYRLRGQHGQRGDLSVAALRFQEALRADPTLSPARLDLAGVLVMQGKYTEAAKMYGSLLAQSPEHHGALNGLALAMVRMGDYGSARVHLTKLVSLSPNQAEAWLDLGDVCHKMGEIHTARDYWTKAMAVAPKDRDLLERAQKRLATYAPLPLAHPSR